MSQRLRVLSLACFFMLAAVVTTHAQQKKRNKNQRNPASNPVLNAAFGDTYLKAKLTPPQEQKLTGLTRQTMPQLNKAYQGILNCYTKEQQETLKRAREMAIRAKVNPKNIEKRVKDAEATFELTDEQKKKIREARAAMAELTAKFAATAGEFLSAQQVKTLFPDAGNKKKK